MVKSSVALLAGWAIFLSPVAWASDGGTGFTPSNSHPLSALLTSLGQETHSGLSGSAPSLASSATKAPTSGADTSAFAPEAPASDSLLSAFKSLQAEGAFRDDAGADADIWTRLDTGFRISDVSRPRVDKWRSWFLQHQGKLEEILHNSEPFLYYVASAVSQRGMPMELALLPAIESGYNPRAFSPAAAAGLWQFVPGTARNFGLQNTRWGDPRLSLTASTNAALDYLSYLHNYFGGNWLLAIASYNAGQGTVSAAIQQNVAAGEPTDFWDLNLPSQTENYVAELLALAQIVKNAQAYHIALPVIPNKAHIALVRTPHQVNLSVAAKLMDVSMSELQRLNAGLSYGVAPADYPLVVPENKAATLKTALLQNTLPTTNTLLAKWEANANSDGTENGITTKSSRAELLNTVVQSNPTPPTATPAAAPMPALHYVAVQSGQTLSGIAQQSGVSVSALMRWNHLRSARDLQVGQHLALYGGHAATPATPRQVVVSSGESLWQIAQRTGVGVGALVAANDITRSSVLHPGQVLRLPTGTNRAVYQTVSHRQQITVRPGESLWQIAQRAGVSVGALVAVNHMRTNSVIHPGQVLQVPLAGTQMAEISPAQEQMATHPTSYLVRPGDTVWQIAQRFHVSPSAVVRWNRLASASDLQPGAHLTIYVR